MEILLLLLCPFMAQALTPCTFLDLKVATSSSAAQMSLTLASNGSLLFAWEGLSNAIYVQFFSQTLISLGSSILVNNPVSHTNVEPQVVAFSTGTFAVIWEHSPPPAIYCQLFYGNGSLNGSSFKINYSGHPTQPTAMIMPNGNFLVTLLVGGAING